MLGEADLEDGQREVHQRAMTRTHDKIIGDAARSQLVPLCFQRKGRSRTWIADHGWWVTVVEFQPSSWSVGSYLNVAAHWLWSDVEHFSFDFGGRVAGFVPYETDGQFAVAMEGLAMIAAKEADNLTRTFPSLESTAAVLLNEERTNRRYGKGGWMAYHAGVAAGLIGSIEDANEMFARVSNGFAQPNSLLAQAAKRIASLVDDPRHFRKEAAALIAARRIALRLPTLSNSPL